MSDWLAEASARGIKPEQALALIGLGLFQRLRGSGDSPAWVWSDAEDGGSADLVSLRQRLELTHLALQTGAPLSTAEVTALLGARPGSAVVERGGLRARRLSRNVWKLSQAEGSGSVDEGRDGGFGGGFGDGFRRRL
ncbi:MAG: hypothetical protein AB1Z22_03225 [Synechococcaceae cyanobacterium]